MSAALLPLRRAFGLRDRPALGLALVALFAIALATAGAARLSMLPLAAGLVVGCAILVLGFRWPLLPLLIYIAVIPIDEIVRLGPLGTVGRTAAILFTITYAIPRLRRLTWDAMPLSAWAYTGWAILSVTWAIDPQVAARELGTLVQLFAIGLLIADVVVHRPSIVRPILWTYSLSCAVVGVIGAGEYFAGQISNGERAAALPNQDPAQFAAVLLPAFAFALLELTGGRLRLLGAAVAFATGSGILLSGTRGAWVSVIVVTILFVVPRMRPSQRLAALAGVVALAVIAMQIPAVRELVTFRTDTAISSGGAGRTDIWSVGLGIIESAPLIGVGYANFPVAYTPELVWSTPVQTVTSTGRGPHNLVIGTLGELGIMGFLLLAWYLIPLLVRRATGPDAVAVQAALASLMVSAMFLDVFGNRKQVWLILGLAVGLAYLERRRRPMAGDVEPANALAAAPSTAASPVRGP